MPQIIIIEDSSRYDLGGGQRITLDAINCLIINKKNKLTLFDLGSGQHFKEKVLQCKIESTFFSITGTLHFFYKLTKIILEIMRSIDTSEKFFLYATTKKALLISVIIKIICRNSVVVFHQHSRLEFYFNWLKLFAKNIIIPGAIEKSYDKKNVVIHNQINIAKPSSNPELKTSNEIVIGFIGSLTKHKGFDIFLEILNHSKMHAIVAGKGVLESKIVKKDNLSFVGYIDEEQKKTFYDKIDILVFPSVVEETFSLVCFEAMFNYIPIVCFDIGYPSKIVKIFNTGIVSQAMTSDGLFVAIKKCVENRKELSGNCLKVIEKFENNNFCKSFSKLFEE